MHVRSGKISITGGSFETGASSTYSYDYVYVSGGSMENYGDAVIEASNSSYGNITSITVTTGATFKNQGLSYFINPAFSSSESYSAPETLSISNEKYNGAKTFIYRRSITSSAFSGYVYFTDDNDSRATDYSGTQTIGGYECTMGDLESATYDSDSGTYSF